MRPNQLHHAKRMGDGDVKALFVIALPPSKVLVGKVHSVHDRHQRAEANNLHSQLQLPARYHAQYFNPTPAYLSKWTSVQGPQGPWSPISQKFSLALAAITWCGGRYLCVHSCLCLSVSHCVAYAHTGVFKQLTAITR